MRLLLIACEFPPVASPQSIRWAYLSRELARAGHEVHVLAPDTTVRGPGGLPDIDDAVRMHRVHPGAVGALANRLLGGGDAAATSVDPSVHALAQPTLNWKGRLRQRIEDRVARVAVHGLDWRNNVVAASRGIASLAMFPDARSAWVPHARRRLDALLDTLRPDAVITSHEPANTLELGLHAKRRGVAWIADLGDPVLAAYTPRRWRGRAHALERAVCEQADLVTVTNARMFDMLAERHGFDAARGLVLTQGFDAHAAPQGPANAFDPARLELLYTGSLYAFRRIDALLDALVAVPAARLTIASAQLPAGVVDAARANPAQVRLLGFVPHRRALDLQRGCDVLVNVANEDAVQVPGKLYEYLGATAPILQIGSLQGGGDDAGSQLVRDAGLGWCEPPRADAIAARLRALADEKARTGTVARPEAPAFDVSRHAWHRLADDLARAIEGVRFPQGVPR